MDENLNNVWDEDGIALDAVFDMRNALLVETPDGVGCFWSEREVLTTMYTIRS
ncbi:hypothetical protein Ct9H90mP29_05700 [bacterium]|nr:MAG: hypothetical protein Ct9H90mP29_05700 [bacterium]